MSRYTVILMSNSWITCLHGSKCSYSTNMPILILGNHSQFIENMCTTCSNVYSVDIWVVDNRASVSSGAEGRIIGFTLRSGDQLLYLGLRAAIWPYGHIAGCDSAERLSKSSILSRLSPNDPYMGRTAPLTSKRCILYIYSTNIGTEYFKHALYSPFFLFKMQFVL